MSCINPIESEASAASLIEYLNGSKQVAITIRIPKHLHELGKEARATMYGMNFSTPVRQGLNQQLAVMK